MGKNDLKKQAALEALANSSTLTEAAEKAGISRRTLYGYIRDDIDFSVAYKSLQEQAALAAYEAAAAQRAHAVDVVASIMDDDSQPSAVRLKAALSIINKADTLNASAFSLADTHVRANNDCFGVGSIFPKTPH